MKNRIIIDSTLFLLFLAFQKTAGGFVSGLKRKVLSFAIFLFYDQPARARLRFGFGTVKPDLNGLIPDYHPLIPVDAMPSTRDFWKMRKMMVAGTMDRVDMASVEPISEPEEGSLNSCNASETGRMLARFTYSSAER